MEIPGAHHAAAGRAFTGLRVGDRGTEQVERVQDLLIPNALRGDYNSGSKPVTRT